MWTLTPTPLPRWTLANVVKRRLAPRVESREIDQDQKREIRLLWSITRLAGYNFGRVYFYLALGDLTPLRLHSLATIRKIG